MPEILTSILILFMMSMVTLLPAEQVPVDYYTAVNEDWFNNSIIPDNLPVINNWDLLWQKITDKSIEILKSEHDYKLEKDDLHNLTALRNLYNSLADSSELQSDKSKVYYIQKAFPMYFGVLFSKITISESKRQFINEIISELKKTFIEKIQNTDRLGNYYKKLFISKIEGLNIIVGAPELTEVPILPEFSQTDFPGNEQLIEEHAAKLQKIQYAKWSQGPFETSCYNIYQQNSIQLYAGILFDLDENNIDDIPYVYATLGRTIAHEMTHSIDAMGQNFDEQGNYVSLFTRFITARGLRKNTLKSVREALITQFSGYTLQDSVYLNGTLMVQENFADLSGFEVACTAMRNYLKEKNDVEGSDDMRQYLTAFFKYYAEFWREKSTAEYELKTAERAHPPQKFRAIGVLYNQDLFYKVINPSEDDLFYIPMEERIKVW